MKNEEEKNLQKKINEIVKGRHDKDKARKAVNELVEMLSKPKVEPVEVCVPLSSVKDRINIGPVELVRTDNEIVYKQNGYYIVVKPWNIRLYDVLNIIFDMDRQLASEKNEDLEKIRDAYVNVLQMSASLPLFIFMDDKFMTDMYLDILTKLNEMLEKKSKEIENTDDEELNHEFRNVVDIIGGIKDGDK